MGDLGALSSEAQAEFEAADAAADRASDITLTLLIGFSMFLSWEAPPRSACLSSRSCGLSPRFRKVPGQSRRCGNKGKGGGPGGGSIARPGLQ